MRAATHRPWLRVAQAIAAALSFGGVASFYLRPIWRILGTRIGPDQFDPVFVLYLLKWGVRQLHAGLPSFWDAPYFFPDRHVVALSDHVFGPSVFAAGLGLVEPNPLVAYNLLLFGTFAGCGLATWWVLRRSGVAFLPALAGGLMFAFSPFRWSQMPHLQVLLMVFVPLTLWTWYRLLDRPTWGRAAAFLACYLLHLSGGVYLAYMIHVALGVFAADRLLWRRRASAPPGGSGADSARDPRPLRRRLARPLAIYAVVAVVAGAALALLFGPYREAGRTTPMAWSPDVLRVWGGSVLSFFTPSSYNYYSGLWPAKLYRAENALFAGILPTLLALAGLAALWRRSAAARRAPHPELPPRPRPALWLRLVLLALFAAGCAGFDLGEIYTWSRPWPRLLRYVPGHGYLVPWWICAGGFAAFFALYRFAYGRWPLSLARMHPWHRGMLLAGAACAALSLAMVYAFARGVVPGLDAMRVPARFYAFTSLAIADLAALQLGRFLAAARRRGGRRLPAIVGGVAVALLLVELTPRPINFQPLPAPREFAPVYHWLRTQPQVKTLLELPINDTDLPIADLVNISYLYYGTLHWKPLVNGYSAHWPGQHRDLELDCCAPMPTAEWLARLRSWGVTHLLVHRDNMEPWEQRAVDAWEKSGVAPRLYADDQDDRVYRLLPAPPAAPKAAPLESPTAPQTAPIKSPQTAPIKSPQTAPIKSPQTTPIKSPQAAPIKSPQTAPVKSPQAPPKPAPPAKPAVR